ncbi:MAG TPA: serine hydrolase domain-containing protein [Bradyrhizobium sp.]|uniref:serine hydrolase domain-containing protein n=1 Tax=Bradyrhizobium sp. TaxID=376 RepID=UPI002BCF7B74|nr:serine hydrolase domain-containing protein [Bradyrhizobium sp.]HLZ06024.1 serine hydrolase domain-containing protein [Bradyrhizobium sp.]
MALAGAGAMLGAPSPSLAAAAPVRNHALDVILKHGVDARDVPGVVAMAATENSIIYQGAFGPRSVGTAAKMSPDTVFRIASMVKLLTSVAAMQLVERNKLKLDGPAETIDPELGSVPVLNGFDNKGVPQMRPPRKPLTLRNLLTHTSGFSYPLWDAEVVRYLKCCRTDKTLPHRPLTFDPDTKWAYGSSIDNVGRLVEIASGMPLERYFHENITGPLGMHDTTVNLSASQRAREASVHRRNANGSFKAEPQEKPTVVTSFTGGGGIYSTAPDYLTLLQALLNGGSLRGTTLLKPETVALMSENQIGDLEAGIMKTTNPALSSDVDFFPHVRKRWSFGHMMTLDPVAGGRKAGSLTWAGLLNTYYWIDPASGIAGVIMMQVLPFADAPALKLYRAFERGVYHAIKAA